MLGSTCSRCGSFWANPGCYVCAPDEPEPKHWDSLMMAEPGLNFEPQEDYCDGIQEENDAQDAQGQD